MISLPNPTTQNIMNRQQLIEDYAHDIVDSMDMNTLIEFAHVTLVSNLEKLSNEELMREVGEFYPELLEENNN